MRHLFDLEDDVHYLNCAYMSPMMNAVGDAGIKGILGKRRPYLYKPDDFFEPVQEARRLFAQLIKEPDVDRIAITTSVSYAMSNAANAIDISSNQKIILLAGQFPSNVYPWTNLTKRNNARVEFVDAPIGKERCKIWNQNILDAIDHTTRIVAVPHVHWADGIKFDLVEIGRKCREVGALLAVDGTQSIGAMAFDQSVIQADVVACSAYKWLMGPYGIGTAYYGPFFDDKLPIEQVWLNRKNSEDFRNLVQYEEAYRPKSIRFSMGGQSNFVMIAMLNKSLQIVNEWGTDPIQSHCQNISEASIEKLQALGLDIADAKSRGAHLFGIGLPKGIDVNGIAQKFKENKIIVSFRGKYIRLSPHLYNSIEDFNLLTKVVTQALIK